MGKTHTKFVLRYPFFTPVPQVIVILTGIVILVVYGFEIRLSLLQSVIFDPRRLMTKVFKSQIWSLQVL